MIDFYALPKNQIAAPHWDQFSMFLNSHWCIESVFIARTLNYLPGKVSGMPVMYCAILNYFIKNKNISWLPSKKPVII